MTTAATQRHGCRSGTASMTSGWVGWRRVDIGHLSPDDQLIAPLISRLVDHARLDAPLRGDVLYVPLSISVLERLLQRLGQRRALGDRPAVRRRVEDLAGGLELAVALLDRVERHRRVGGHRVDLAEHDGVGRRRPARRT